jgi:hypothetical protein
MCQQCSNRAYGERHSERLITKSRQYYRDNREQILAHKHQEHIANPKKAWYANLYHCFRLRPAEVDAILERQRGVCAVCKDRRPVARKRRLHLDHDRNTGIIRGFLCGRCNIGIGQLGHDAERIGSAITYLTNPPGPSARGRDGP